MMDLRSKGSTSEGQGSGVVKGCVECKATKTPLWRTGPAGPKSLCNACGIRLKKRLASEEKGKRNDLPVNQRKKPRTRKVRPTASISTICSTTDIVASKSTSITAKSAAPDAVGKSAFSTVKSASLAAAASASAFGNAGGDGNTGGNVLAGGVHRRYFFRVRFIGNNQRVVKKLRCFQRRRTNFRRTGFYFLNRNGRTMAEVEQAAVLALLSLSAGSAPS